jgi:penicillin-binding protein 1A
LKPVIKQISVLFQNFISFFSSLSLFKKTITLLGILLSFGFVFLSFLYILIVSGILGDMPGKHELSQVENPSASEVFSADSVLLGRYFLQERSTIAFDKLPTHVVEALIATEDIRFYDHHGIDKKSLLRVFVKSLLFQNDAAGGGSTITQQLAKNLYPRKDFVLFSLLINKMREMIIASRLEDVYDKNSILTLYLNTVPFGENTYGIDAAAQLFFSVPAERLSINQGAVLIGMLKANHFYNPRLFPDRSRQRRNIVLAQMAKYTMLPAEQRDSLRVLPIALLYNKITHHSGLAPYFREYLRPELLAWCEEYNKTHEPQLNLYTGGLKIYTTIDSRLQRYAEQSVTLQMSALQKTFQRHWGSREPWESYPDMMDEIIQRSEHYKILKRQGFSNNEIMSVLRTPVPMTIFNWKGEQEVTMSPIDSIKHYLAFLQAGVFAMDPTQGAVRVWVGGINHNYFQFDHVRESTKRQVGSTFKPIVYAAALEQGVAPCDFISAEKVVYSNVDNWTPENGEDNYGLKYSMPGALAHSINTVSVRVLEKAGIDNTVKLAHTMGINSELQPVPSIALGTPDISMMEMVTAYTAFAREGKIVKPFYITAITTHRGDVLEKFLPHKPYQALSSESAQLILHMLRRSVNEGGTSGSLRSRYNLANDMAGKTGTTQSNTDGWFMAITPNLIMGAWVGADDPRIRFRSTALGQGARTALPLVANFYQLANQDPTLVQITRARFPELSHALERRVDCDFFKTENNFLKRIFVKKNKEQKREFGKPKKEGFFKRLFSK